MKLLSVVFSFRNEEGNIKELVERVNQSVKKLANWECEIIFVNDALQMIQKIFYLNYKKNIQSE